MASTTPDAVKGWVDRLPPRAQSFARLARFDRPAGLWLLFWPCLFGYFLAPEGWQFPLLFFIGAVAMRAAGCVYNDIIDRDLDAQVARTAARPIASGAISVRSGWLFLVALSLVGLAVLLALPLQAQLVALGSLALVAAYPFMKRITWWPQAWLGLTFNWGVWVGWAALDPADRPGWPIAALLYGAGICWTLGYDSIYAAQDSEDDALAGIKSSARRLGGSLIPGVALFYAIAMLFMALALWVWTENPVVLLALVPVGAHLAWQAATLRPGDTRNTLRRFQSNREAGGLMAFAVLAAHLLDAGGATP